jgi:hypothetical protein
VVLRKTGLRRYTYLPQRACRWVAPREIAASFAYFFGFCALTLNQNTTVTPRDNANTSQAEVQGVSKPNTTRRRKFSRRIIKTTGRTNRKRKVTTKTANAPSSTTGTTNQTRSQRSHKIGGEGGGGKEEKYYYESNQKTAPCKVTSTHIHIVTHANHGSDKSPT